MKINEKRDIIMAFWGADEWWADGEGTSRRLPRFLNLLYCHYPKYLPLICLSLFWRVFSALTLPSLAGRFCCERLGVVSIFSRVNYTVKSDNLSASMPRIAVRFCESPLYNFPKLSITGYHRSIILGCFGFISETDPSSASDLSGDLLTCIDEERIFFSPSFRSSIFSFDINVA